MIPEGGNKHILVVDDDPNIRRFLSESLRLHGYEVHSFEDAETALEDLDKHDFSLALLDILLPGTNGLQLCRKLRGIPKTSELPIIMMTAFYKQADHIQDAREQYGATDYLLKPFPLKTLHEKIDALLGAPATASETGRLNIEGKLSETAFPRILHNLYSLRATGLLHLQHNNLKKVVYIRKGYPIFVRSNLVREFLGQMLVRTGRLSDEALAESLEASKQSNQRHGTALIEMGLLTPHQLNDALRTQVLDKLLDTFSWPEGKYRFVQAREFKQGITSIDLSPANLILQGLRDHANRDQVLKILEPHLEHYLQQAENPLYRFQEIQLSVNEQRILASCQGNETLSEVLKRYLLSRKEAEPLLAALLTTGILVARMEPEEPKEEAGCDETELTRARRESFLKDYAWMMEQDYFTLLGVSESHSREQVRKSYYNLVKKYHPDRFFEQNTLPDLKDKVNALFQRISDAHETLSDVNAKARYLNDRQGEKKSSTTSLEKILQAETAFQKGIVLFRVKKYDQAQKTFAEALAISPNEAEYLMYQTWSAYKFNPKATDVIINARKNLLRAIELNPKLSLAHLFLGYVCKDGGNENEALRHFERAIQCNRNCTEALREIRLMSMRKEKGKKGLFGKMFS
jgi:DNA-binding response OmpR family regulator/curved DNA-binding protein CbpA